MGKEVTLDDVLDLVEQLSVIDKVRLIERLAPQIEQALEGSLATSRKSLRGIWKGADITEEDIAEIRREMWSNIPRDDI